MTADSARWFLLGFLPDEVICAEQNARLAAECVKARRAEGRPSGFRILQAPGEGDHLLYWFVSEESAWILDAHGVDWRRFLVAGGTIPPRSARDAIAEGSEPESLRARGGIGVAI